MREVGRHSQHCSFVLEVVLLQNELQLVEVSCVDLLGVEVLHLSLRPNLERNSVLFRDAFGRTELGLGPEEGEGRGKAEEAHGVGDCVFEVGFHFNVAGFTNVAL